MSKNRRQFFAASAAIGISAFSWPSGRCRGDDCDESKKSADTVGAAEDLMREHGVLNRILLVYEECLRRLREGDDLGPEAFHRPALLVSQFIHDYHERLEETYVFPEFDRAGKLVTLVNVLREQHCAGREATDVVLRNANPDRFSKPDARDALKRACAAFIRMYRPHEAREDTVVYPAFHRLVSPEKLRELGERFEMEEDRLFGHEGFEKTVAQVAEIEKQLGIGDLAAFTPK
jgi:hemerythrin-like domain-containing protein